VTQDERQEAISQHSAAIAILNRWPGLFDGKSDDSHVDIHALIGWHQLKIRDLQQVATPETIREKVREVMQINFQRVH